MGVSKKPNEKRKPSSPSPPKVEKGRLLKKAKTRESDQADTETQATRNNPEKQLRPKRATVDSQSSAFERAKEVQANLSLQFPSLIKSMLPSHVTGGFWLGLPKKFCEMHLPKTDSPIVLEDESGKEYETKYLTDKVGLSAGWRGFSIAHNLLEGDVLVLQLVQPLKFKVYIIRSRGSNEVDVALSLLNLDYAMRQHDSKNDPKSTQVICDADIPPLLQLESTSEEFEDFSSEVLGGIIFSDSTINFQEVTSVENFKILVNGLIIDSEFSKHIKTKYYELCCSQKMFLHEHLLEGLNCKLVAGMISEIINIADAIRASKITTPAESFGVWHKTLKAFEAMGMNTGFLLERLDQLINLTLKSQRCKEVSLERDRAEEARKILEAKLVEVKETIDRLDVEIETQDLNIQRLESVFQELAHSPW